MLKWPHLFEIEAARGRLQALDLYGSFRETFAMPAGADRITAFRRYLLRANWREFSEHGVCSAPTFEWLATMFRWRIPANACLLSPCALRRKNLDRQTHA